MASRSHGLVTHPEGVKEVLVDDLFPNPHNPRVLFDKLPMTVLRDSIKRVGILVPLTVYWEKAKEVYLWTPDPRWRVTSAANGQLSANGTPIVTVTR